eukprot:3644905-Ditylum_brightwellii.AAC.1
MKLAPIATKSSDPDVKRAIILFQRPAARNLEKGKYHTCKLRTNPADPTSPIYKLAVPFFDKGMPEE